VAYGLSVPDHRLVAAGDAGFYRSMRDSWPKGKSTFPMRFRAAGRRRGFRGPTKAGGAGIKFLTIASGAPPRTGREFYHYAPKMRKIT